jgi:hypothetical protein
MHGRFRVPELLLGALLMLAFVSVVLVLSSQKGVDQPASIVPHVIEQASGNPPAMTSASPGSEESPLFVRIQKSEQEVAEERQDRENKATTDWLLATYTLLLFLATLGLMVATIGLWYFALRQSRDTRESLAIASRSADAAKASADIARQAFTQLERPYVFVAGIGRLLQPTERGGNLHVIFGIANLGRSPAFVSDLWAELFVLSNPVAANVRVLGFSNTVHKLGDVLAGGEKMEDIVCFMRPDATRQIEEIRNKDTYLILKVAVLYSDIFGAKHHSNFHWLYDPDRDYFSSYAAAGCNTYD